MAKTKKFAMRTKQLRTKSHPSTMEGSEKRKHLVRSLRLERMHGTKRILTTRKSDVTSDWLFSLLWVFYALLFPRFSFPFSFSFFPVLQLKRTSTLNLFDFSTFSNLFPRKTTPPEDFLEKSRKVEEIQKVVKQFYRFFSSMTHLQQFLSFLFLRLRRIKKRIILLHQLQFILL